MVALPPAPPSNTALPAVSGTTTQGQTLSTSNGTWTGSPTSYSYQWKDCDSSGNNCTTISGATTSTYQLAASDVAHTVRAVITATNAGGSTSATASATAAVVALPPTAAFSFSPTAAVTGQNVHFDASGSHCYASPCTYSWEDDPPSGGSWPLGTGQTLDFTFQGAGTKYVTLIVTDSGSNTATIEHDVVVSAAVTSAPSNTALPAVSGTTSQGQTLSTSNGTWTGSPTSYSYQWKDCDSSGNNCTTISGATTSTYQLAASDVGHTVRAVITATNAGGSTSATSGQTTLVSAAVTSAPSNTALPAVSGTTSQGQTLSTSNGTWTGSPTSYSYQWKDCDSSGNNCTTISGATTSTYQLAASDVAHTVRAVITATNAGGSASATSAQTAVVASSGSGGGTAAPAYNPPACTQTTDTTGWISVIGSATAPAVICLKAGTYPDHEFVYPALDKAATGGGVVIEPSPGQSVTLGTITVTGGHNVTFEGFSSLNGSSSSGGLTVQGQYGDTVSNFTWEFNSMSSYGAVILGDPAPNLNILITNNKFVGFANAGEADRLRFVQDPGTLSCATLGPSGIVASFNLLANGQADGTKVDGTTCAAQIQHNIYSNIYEGNCGAIHCDPIQDDGGDKGTGTVINGNYFTGTPDTSGAILQDSNGAGPDIITNNVFDDGGCQEGTYNGNSVESHNTYNCTLGTSVNFWTPSTNVQMTNNVFTSVSGVTWGPDNSCCSWKAGSPDYNLHTSGAYGSTATTGAHDVIGTPTFQGGSAPSTWAGWQLTGSSATPGSPPLGSDGKPMGADVSVAPGPSW